MSVILRGIKNTFRNKIRTGSIALILGISLGLGLVMVISLNTIDAKIAEVKASIGNAITITPAGVNGLQGGGEPLTQDQINQVKSLDHVVGVNATLNDRLTPVTDTSLVSAIEAGSLGQRFNRRPDDSGGSVSFNGPGGQAPANFTPPIILNGTTQPSLNNGSLSSGEWFSSNSTDNVAVIGKALADKNSLTVGGTFKAYDIDIKVVGIFDAGNQFANAGLVMPLATLQKLSDQTGDVTAATLQVDSISNVSSATQAVKDKLGDSADVTSSEDTATQAVEPLESIRSIAVYSLIGSLGASAVIIFLAMLMVVRDRRREIGVLKAIGASDSNIMVQFSAEAATLTLIAAIIGICLSLVLSNPILNSLASNAEPQGPTITNTQAGGRAGGRATRAFGGPQGAITQISGAFNGRQALETLNARIGYQDLLYGLVAALAIAILGSAIPAWFTTKVRPAEVMRGE